MVDPIGVPTFAQMFSPSKSPYYAISLIALACITLIYKSPLADYGIGLVLFVLLSATVLAPFYRPRYTNRSYGLGLVFGRTAGIAGGLIAIGILISKSSFAPPNGEDALLFNTVFFRVLWKLCIAHICVMGLLTFVRTGQTDDGQSRFNIMQFCVMQSILLCFLTVVGTGIPINSYGDVDAVFLQSLTTGVSTLAFCVFQPFVFQTIDNNQLFCALLTLWTLSAAVNLLLLARVIRPGWVSDHGDDTGA
jgi:hypothetical protein